MISHIKSWNGQKSAPAKVNLSLRIVGRLSNGFHVLHSLILPLTLVDEIEISLAPGKGNIEFNCRIGQMLQEHIGDTSALVSELNSEANLAYRAVDRCLLELGLRDKLDVRLSLTKNIPVQAGLGGGSSDAAAVLLLLRDALKDNLPPKFKVEAVAQLLGSDVCAFLREGAVFVYGCGGHTKPVDRAPNLQMIILKPDFGIKTSEAYRLFDSTVQDLPAFADIDEYLLKYAQEIESDFSFIKKNVKTSGFSGSEKNWFQGFVRNDFEDVIFDCYAELKQIQQTLYQQGATHVLLAGSGSALIGFVKNEQAANELEARMRNIVPARTFLTTAKLMLQNSSSSREREEGVEVKLKSKNFDFA